MSILRVGLYERVSTDEQAIHGYSIGTQIANLEEYCKQKKMKIVDHYTDEGISGAKPPLKRPALQRLLDDVKAGKIDMILFTKLDRWFRSVQEYFKVQEILESHRVEWKAIHEDYDTTTANGRMAITIFLAVAQNERDKGSERVRVVLEQKRKNKEACFGGPNKPLGYMKQLDENGIRRLVKDPDEEEMMNDFWRILVEHKNLNRAIRHTNERYGVTRSGKSWTRMARNELYTGTYKGVEGFCEPYVSREDWQEIQDRTRTKYPTGRGARVYLFSGMMRCPECDHIMCGSYNTKPHSTGPKEYKNYRCRFRLTNCTNQCNVSEMKLERWLLNGWKEHIKREIQRVETENAKPKQKPKYNISALKEKLRRAEVVYMAGNKSDEEYLAETKEIKAKIEEAQNTAPPPVRDVEPFKKLLEIDIKAVYNTLDQEGKRRFWQSMIKEIKLEGNNPISVVFF